MKIIFKPLLKSLLFYIKAIIPLCRFYIKMLPFQNRNTFVYLVNRWTFSRISQSASSFRNVSGYNTEYNLYFKPRSGYFGGSWTLPKKLTSPALLGTRIYGTFYDETLRRSEIMLIPNDYFSINIKKSETARRDICRGLVLAENPFRLLMFAVKCITDMSGDGTFLSSCQQSLENIYGAVFVCSLVSRLMSLK